MFTRYRYMVITMVAAVFMLTGCRKDLCFEPYHPHQRQLRVVIDYSQMDYVPDQIRLDFYSLTDGRHHMRFITATNNVVKLPFGLYEMVAFNDNSDFLEVYGEDQYRTILAYLPKITRSQYNMLYAGRQLPFSIVASRGGLDSETPVFDTPTGRAAEVGVYSIGQPELLFVASLDMLEVKDMDGIQEVHLRPVNTTVVYHLNVKVIGLEYVLQARGNMTGVSPSMFLHNKQREWVNGTVMFDCLRQGNGISASVTAFGMIRGGEQNLYMPEHNILKFEFLLKDGSIYTVTYDIAYLLTDELCVYGGILNLDDIVINIPKVDTDGGFNAKLEDWYDEETISLL